MDEIDKRTDITDEEKQKLKEEKRRKWQRLGRFALNRWGRENALAAGLALYLGITDRIILSGGRTKPGWAEKQLGEEVVKDENWPSEAELMRDIIRRRFGEIYRERYGKPIDEAIQIEDESTNTLLNFANTILKNPGLISKEKSIGLLAADFHMARCEILAKLYTIATDNQDWNIKAQSFLNERAKLRKKDRYQEIQKWLTDLDNNPDLQERQKGEKRWIRGLTEPGFLGYFAPYFSRFNTPETVGVLQHFLNLIKTPGWREHAAQVFQNVGLNLTDFTEEDLQKLLLENPEKFQQLIEGLRKIERVFPPEEK